MSEAIHVTIDGPIAEITIDRPKANALDAATSRVLGGHFAAFERDPSIRIVILTGAGDRIFSAGWDLNAADDGEAFEADYGVGGFGGFPELPDRTKPVIAAVNGKAVGGGFEIAMAADFIVAAEHAEFWLPEARLGMLPDAGAVKLARLLPPHIARELLLTSRRMSAEEGARWGLINRVVASAELLHAARELAQEVIEAPAASVAAILAVMRETEHLRQAEAMVAMRSIPSYRDLIDNPPTV